MDLNYYSPGHFNKRDAELLNEMQFESTKQVYFEKFQQVSEHNNEYLRCIKINKYYAESYTVSIENLDQKYFDFGNSFMLIPKQMKVFEQGEKIIRLRGFGENLLGYPEDVHGISLHIAQNIIQEVVYHRFDFYSHIVFYKKNF